jgi:hypothetical protein
MKYSIVLRVAIALFLSVPALTALSRAGTPRPEEAAGTAGVVVLETEGSPGISVRIAEELARATNDGTRRRILPVVGAGSLQNITDFYFYRALIFPFCKQTPSIT